jgi:hypothetical protein
MLCGVQPARILNRLLAAETIVSSLGLCVQTLLRERRRGSTNQDCRRDKDMPEHRFSFLTAQDKACALRAHVSGNETREKGKRSG